MLLTLHSGAFLQTPLQLRRAGNERKIPYGNYRGSAAIRRTARKRGA